MRDTFDYAIGTEKMRPIDGYYQYSAKLKWLVRNPGPKSTVIRYAEHQIHNEFWGETAQDAYNKADSAVRKWIDRQSN
jgi:hypothetical protein